MKQKKLSLQQQKNMIHARSQRGASYDQTLEALVVAHYGKTLDCIADNKVYTLKNSRTFDVVVGDWILLGLSSGKDLELIEHKPRRNVLYRNARDGSTKSLAANIDLACVVLALEPEPWPQIVAQYFTHLQHLRIPCCFVLNKFDKGLPPLWLDERLSYLAEKFSVPVLRTSAYTRLGLEALESLLINKTSIIIGPSGVGKSSLLQHLLSNQSIRVGDLSATSKGQHTTSVTQLYALTNQTHLIDSPGIRQLAMEHFTLQELLMGFPDFQELGCRFKDCDHVHSGGCVVFGALERGDIPQYRYDDYLYLRSKFLNTPNK